MRYIQRFDSASTEQAAIDAGQLGKPYIAFIEDGQYIDWNTKTPATSGLPSNTFLFNYNAKEYVASANTLPRTSGQTLPEDIRIRANQLTVYEDSFKVNSDAKSLVQYNSYLNNPLNRNSADTTFTFIYKTKDFINARDRNLVCVRYVDASRFGVNEDEVYDAYNWMVRSDAFHVQDKILSFTPLNNPQIIAIRVNADGSGERVELDAQGNVVQSASTPYVEWGKQAAGFYWFGSRFASEWFNSTFYWMYCSTEALTDQEIRQVIDYNENL